MVAIGHGNLSFLSRLRTDTGMPKRQAAANQDRESGTLCFRTLAPNTKPRASRGEQAHSAKTLPTRAIRRISYSIPSLDTIQTAQPMSLHGVALSRSPSRHDSANVLSDDRLSFFESFKPAEGIEDPFQRKRVFLKKMLFQYLTASIDKAIASQARGI